MFINLILAGFLTLVELNCENLFDARHDTLKNDVEFTPESNYHWTWGRYWRKVNAIGREIIACGGDSAWTLPDLVALCEVENDSVMRDLTKRSLLRTARYEYIMTDSPDERGIDVALMYSPFAFVPINHHSLRIKPTKDMHPTRDILYVSGQIITGDTLHIFVVHAPSRTGGERASRPHRMLVADKLGVAIDSIYAQQPNAKIILTGDFNDYATSIPLQQIYSHNIINVSQHAEGNNGARATYRYQGEWGSLDQVMCSPSMQGYLKKCEIGDFLFLLEEDEKYGGYKPKRTYYGPRYNNGYSDHLPLITMFEF